MNFIFAYIDPGTGAMLLQILIAGILGVSMYFRRAIARIAFWKRPPNTRDDAKSPSRNKTTDDSDDSRK